MVAMLTHNSRIINDKTNSVHFISSSPSCLISNSNDYLLKVLYWQIFITITTCISHSPKTNNSSITTCCDYSLQDVTKHNLRLIVKRLSSIPVWEVIICERSLLMWRHKDQKRSMTSLWITGAWNKKKKKNERGNKMKMFLDKTKRRSLIFVFT